MGILSSELPMKSMVPLCRQLATAYDAGIPLVQTFDLLQREMKDPRVRAVMGRIRDRIKSGATLAEAARAESKYLPNYVVEVLAAGEVGGKLDVMFRDLAAYFEDRLAMRRQIIASLAYPAFVLCTAWFMGTFAIRMIRQVIASVFETRGGAFSFVDYIYGYLWFQGKAMAIVAIIVAIAIILARMGVLKWIWAAVATHVWPFAPVTKRFGLARFFRSMSLLIGAGLPIHRCIERSAAVVNNPYIERDLLKAIPGVMQGRTLTESFAGSRYLLPTAYEMLHVGEETGSLELQLRKVSQFFLEEASHAVAMALKVLSAAAIIVVGCVVGYVVISFYGSYLGAITNAF